jgi:ribonuclease HI
VAEPAVLTIFTDGASRGNPGEAAYAYVIRQDDVDILEEAGYLGRITNNQAEYTALVKALEHALELGADNEITVNSDSELMVKQMRGEYKVKNAELRPLYDQASDLVDRFTSTVTFCHVRREKNKRADALCNEILDGIRPSSLPRHLPTPTARPARVAPKPVPPAPKPAPATSAQLHREASVALRKAQEAWMAGKVVPTPDEVWQEIRAILERHGIRVP